ncbi:hypothetical protein PSMK_05960 [Phycisphaera mikurensis NBRC 102666]|uniref:BNR repeat-containing family member n=1 Tax=Phycisphaera mikurensis (strain NBRC 102666 / KCTC 22515 / FYK2301M01) TaxID=1142394 RepID=I0IBW7_PHYMF|nr:hypothetical protein PSMK_05960 [Phycisphaera mikurensis NBRC 102666]
MRLPLLPALALLLASGTLLPVATGTAYAAAVNAVPEVFDLTSERPDTGGAWCWYQDERVVIDDDAPGGPILLASTVGFGPEGTPGRGDIDLLWRNLATGQTGAFTLNTGMPPDDHNSAAIHVRADGRYVALYARHWGENLIRYRVSTNPHDPTAWSQEKQMRHNAEICYSNIVPAKMADGRTRLLNFARSNGYDPNWFVSEDDGGTWTYGGKLLTGPDGNGAGNQRPYVKYAPGADGSVHFTTTDGHPRDEDNGVYHGVLRAGKLEASGGTVLGPLAREPRSPHHAADFTALLTPGQRFAGVPMHRGWTIDLDVDDDGNPWTVFSARARDDDGDHRFFYARHDGSSWAVHEVARAGGYLYKAENDYTGLVALHPENPDLIFVSTPVDPRDDAKLDRYEIFKGVTGDGGASWAWTPVTWDSAEDNTRPVVPRRPGGDTALLWMRGTCHTYKHWDAKTVGFTADAAALGRLGVPGQATVTREATPPDADAS